MSVFYGLRNNLPQSGGSQPPQPLKLPREVWINPAADGPEPRTLVLPHYTNFHEELSQTRWHVPQSHVKFGV